MALRGPMRNNIGPGERSGCDQCHLSQKQAELARRSLGVSLRAGLYSSLTLLTKPPEGVFAAWSPAEPASGLLRLAVTIPHARPELARRVRQRYCYV
jgi:hypothetical protein